MLKEKSPARFKKPASEISVVPSPPSISPVTNPKSLKIKVSFLLPPVRFSMSPVISMELRNPEFIPVMVQTLIASGPTRVSLPSPPVIFVIGKVVVPSSEVEPSMVTVPSELTVSVTSLLSPARFISEPETRAEDTRGASGTSFLVIPLGTISVSSSRWPVGRTSSITVS